MKFINVKWVFLFVLVYALSIIVTVPIQYVLPYAQNGLSTAGITVQSANGSVWSGQGRLSHRQLGSLNVTWHTQPFSLLLLKLPITLTVSNPTLSLTGQVTPSLAGISVQGLSGYVDDAAATPWLQPNRIALNGRLQLDEVAVSSSWQFELGDANGQATWSGGAISLPVGRQVQSFEVPMMLGELTSNEKEWFFAIDSSDGQRFIDATLSRDGLASLSVKRVLAEAMSLPIPAGGQSLFDISQQVF